MIFGRRTLTGLCALAVTLGTLGAAAAGTADRPDDGRRAHNLCLHGSSNCVKVTIDEMKSRFAPLARACSHQAVFSLAYLRTTQEYARAAAEPGFFEDVRYVNHEDAVFAKYYFDAYDAWAKGRGNVPESWQIAFDAADDREVTGSGNLLLGMNAHVNRDLPFVLADIGIVAPDGSSRKPDHDKVNKFLRRVVDPLLAEEARRFDPTMDDYDTPYGLSYEALFQVLKGWREQAWQNARLLVNAPNPVVRAAVAADIEAYAAATARDLKTSYRYRPPPLSDAEARDAYCVARVGDGALPGVIG